MSLSKKYSQSYSHDRIMRFKTVHPGGDCFDGIVKKIERNFVVLAVFNDFEFFGHVVMPKKHIKGYRDSTFEDCENEIIRQNGQIKKSNLPKWMNNCSSAKAVAEQIFKRKIWPSIETISPDGSDTYFFIGPILETQNKHCTIYCYGADGNWEDAYPINYTDIFKIELGDRYAKYFNRYMKNSPNKNMQRTGDMLRQLI